MAKKRRLSVKSEPTPEPTPEPPKEPTPEPEADEAMEDNPASENEEAEGEAEPSDEEEEEEAPSTKPDEPNGVPAAAAPAPAAEDSDSDPAAVQNLLEPLSKDILIDLLRDAAVAHPDVLAKVHAIADQDPALRKIFVHGLGWDTTADTLIAAFSPYGEIEDCNAVTDKITGKSKGYAFILFKHRSGARKALLEPQKKIGSRMTACQLASAGPVPPPAPPVSEYTQRKIFVSNVGADVDPQKLLQFFTRYGEVEEGPLGLDKATGKPKGFALFVYKTVESARKALQEPHKNFEGQVLHCQKAIDGPKPGKPGFHFQHGGSNVGGTNYARNDSSGYAGGGISSVQQPGHLMAPSATGMGYNQAAVPPAAAAAGLTPALGQALTAILATQGAGLGLTNLLGSLGSGGMGGGMVNQSVPAPMSNTGVHGMQGGYGNQPGYGGSAMGQGGYGAPAPMQGGYGSSAMGQGGGGRGQVGHMGGGAPYMGR